MPKVRDYANSDNLAAALDKEGLSHIPHRVEPSEGTRLKPIFLLTIGNAEHDALVTRLAAEGFSWEVPAPEPADDTTGEMAAAGYPDAAPEGYVATEDGTLAPVTPLADRQTFTVPEGFEAVRDEDGAATGNIRRIITETPPAAENTTGIPNRRSPIDIDVSDLFFNYSHDGYDSLFEQHTLTAGDGPEPEELIAAIRKDAEEFRGSVLRAFGTAIDIDELVDDFFERL